MVEQISLFKPASLSISDLTHYLQAMMEEDPILKSVWVQGEISNLSRAASGHIYLTLKDSGASLKAVIWRTSAQRLRVALQNGMAVEAHGSIGIYERDGVYQLYIDTVRASGEGALYQEFLRLKARLEAEGLFDEEHKRPIPGFPHCIGMVTSPTGAALQDMLNTLRSRFPLVEVLLAPSAVQGEDAPDELAAGIEALNRSGKPDVILVARGGGSLEDLWAFNDERVVRAIAASRIPVITGVGHETDFTLADFASDLRAPTPTGAAVLATPDKADLSLSLSRLQQRLMGATRQELESFRAQIETDQARLLRVSPRWRIQNDRQRLDARMQQSLSTVQHLLALNHARLRADEQRLAALNPLAVLQRGYALVRTNEGGLVSRVSQVQPGQQVQVRLAEGAFSAEVQAVQVQDQEQQA